MAIFFLFRWLVSSWLIFAWWIYAHTVWFCYSFSFFVFCSTCLCCFATPSPLSFPMKCDGISKLTIYLCSWWQTSCHIIRLTSQSCFFKAGLRIAFIQKKDEWHIGLYILIESSFMKDSCCFNCQQIILDVKVMKNALSVQHHSCLLKKRGKNLDTVSCILLM